MKKLLIPKALLWLLLALSAVSTLTGIFLTQASLSLMGAWQAIGLILYSAVWLVLLVDVLENSIRKESLWLTFFLFLPFLAPLPYLIRREKLIAAGRKQHARFSPFMHDQSGWGKRLN